MKKTVIIGIVMLLCAVAGLRAQDTIDTNYYRYDYHYNFYDLWGSDNNLINGFVHVCPNGVGFYNYKSWRFDDRLYNSTEDNINGNVSSSGFNGSTIDRSSDGYLIPYSNNGGNPYMCYKLGSTGQTVYGIAFAIDSIFNLTEGDSMTAILCTRSADRTHFIDLDSITIKGGETGKRRWMELPMLKSEVYENEFDENSQPFETCIDTVRYLQVLEFYFDGRRYTIDDDYVFWKLRVSDGNGSVFCGTNICHILSFLTFSRSDEPDELQGDVGVMTFDFLFPIIAPLPEWEEPTITQVVPDAHKPNTPDPQDPDDPQNPDDPDNPGGDEGIGHADAFGFTIYPNPASGYAVVTCDAPILELTLCDINGRLLLSLHNCGGSAKVDTSPLAPGFYMLHVTTNAGTVTRKLAVK